MIGIVFDVTSAAVYAPPGVAWWLRDGGAERALGDVFQQAGDEAKPRCGRWSCFVALAGRDRELAGGHGPSPVHDLFSLRERNPCGRENTMHPTRVAGMGLDAG